MLAKNTIIGLLAHVDAGKTTLSESLLYTAKAIRRAGRVDHKDSVLDYDDFERKRGITIYAKEARLKIADIEHVLEDTPGHIDFSAEMERVLPVIDQAILLVDASSAIKAYTKKLFALLRNHHIPTIIFLNKIDLVYGNLKDYISDIKKELGVEIVDMTTADPSIFEDLATLDERMLEKYLNLKTLEDDDIYELFKREAFYPLIRGSALKHTNVKRLLEVIKMLCRPKEYPDEFKAYVYRTSTDRKGNRLTYLKINGGTLKVKDRIGAQKVDELRSYSGTDYKSVNEVFAGDVVAARGIGDLFIGEYINDTKKDIKAEMVPYLRYELIPENTDADTLYKALFDLQVENPLLDVDRQNNHIHISLMGNIQKEVLKERLFKKGIAVAFGESFINYNETIKRSSYGIGHFEPLRHYAEVHISVRPLKRGSGKIVKNPHNIKDHYIDVLVDLFQNRDIVGVRRADPLVDVEINIEALKTSLNHTVSEDVRKAARLALRNALLDNESIILEPYEDYRFEVAEELVSRLIFEIEKVGGTYKLKASGQLTIVFGKMSTKSLSELMQKEIFRQKDIMVEHSFCGYEEVSDAIDLDNGYDPYNDPDNICGSIFFKNGSGYYVTPQETYELAHIKPLIKQPGQSFYSYNRYRIDEAEVQEVFARANPQKRNGYVQKEQKENSKYHSKEVKKEDLYIVDGYNLLFSLKKDADINYDRSTIIDMLDYYQSIKGVKMWVVFDAYKVDRPSNRGEDFKIIYTSKNETADIYIQKCTREYKDRYAIIVVSSDHLIQVAALGDGARRMSSRTMLKRIEELKKGQKSIQKTSHKPFKDLFAAAKIDTDEKE